MACVASTNQSVHEHNQEATTDGRLAQRWSLHSRVSLRPEPFGALAYHYDNRKLQFLRSPDLVKLVTSLADYQSPRQAFDAQGLDPKRWPSFRSALLALADSAFIQPGGAELPTPLVDDN